MRVGSIKVGASYYIEIPLFCRSNISMVLDKKEILYALKVGTVDCGSILTRTKTLNLKSVIPSFLGKS
jgi:hypothetical protein